MRVATLHNKKSFSHADKRAAVELWKAKVSQKAIRDQLGMSKATLKRILAFAKANPENPIAGRKTGSGRPSKFSTATQEVIQKDGWTTHY